MPIGLMLLVGHGMMMTMDGYWGNWKETWKAEEHAEEPSSRDDGDDAGLREAQHVQNVAEGLAAEAQRSWSEAQRATQALKKDRGFGQHRPQGSGCFICGNPGHGYRKCPDRTHPYYMKGKGKGKGKSLGSYMTEYDPYTTYLMNKGKGKSKGKSSGKHAMWLDAQVAWKGRESRRANCPLVLPSMHTPLNLSMAWRCSPCFR